MISDYFQVKYELQSPVATSVLSPWRESSCSPQDSKSSAAPEASGTEDCPVHFQWELEHCFQEAVAVHFPKDWTEKGTGTPGHRDPSFLSSPTTSFLSSLAKGLVLLPALTWRSVLFLFNSSLEQKNIWFCIQASNLSSQNLQATCGVLERFQMEGSQARVS